MRCFSSLGLHGYSGINARLTTPPDFSQSSTPLRLLVPRHPPHALTSLTTLLSSPDDLRQDPVPFEACHPSPGIAFARLGNNSFFPSKAHSSFNLHSNLTTRLACSACHHASQDPLAVAWMQLLPIPNCQRSPAVQRLFTGWLGCFHPSFVRRFSPTLIERLIASAFDTSVYIVAKNTLRLIRFGVNRAVRFIFTTPSRQHHHFYQRMEMRGIEPLTSSLQS